MVGESLSDDVTKKTCGEGNQAEHHISLNMSEIDHYIISKDGVNETGTNSEGIDPDRCPVGQ